MPWRRSVDEPDQTLRMTRRDVNSRSGSVYGGVGQPDHGLSFLEEALARAARSDERWYEAELHRLRGEVLALVPRREAEVEAALLRAITVARSREPGCGSCARLRPSVTVGATRDSLMKLGPSSVLSTAGSLRGSIRPF